MSNEEITELANIFLKLRTKEEISSFLKDILTHKEIENLTKRWDIVKLLLQKKQYTEIERLTGASSATISKLQESVKYGEGSFDLLISRMK